MRLVGLEATDADAVRALQAASGYAFQFPPLHSPLVETGCMILDSAGSPIAASVAQRTPEILLAMRKEGHPAIKLQALAMVHQFMRQELSSRGYAEGFCFLPPEIEKSYGRHLQRIFGWRKTWAGYALKEEKSA